jgi:hypothetical protein
LLLGKGHAPRQIANTVGVTENTVRSQIKSFLENRIKRQGALIRLLLSFSGPTIQATPRRKAVNFPKSDVRKVFSAVLFRSAT